ncbi:MAG: RND family transporter [Deltaproteobacteria bacterium]|nr:RND family transporter [Deltaproteobacteria bacterium]MBW2417814.1 RND family transporter [Deltaproteobacteria bacterium]
MSAIDVLVTRARGPVLALVALITALLGFFAARVPVDVDNESMKTQTREQLDTYDEFRRIFGSDEDLVLAVNHPHPLAPAGVRLLDALGARVEAIDGVRRVYSLSNAIELVPGPDGAEERALLPRPAEGSDYEGRALAAVERNPELTGFLVSSDRRTAAVVIEIELRPGDDRYRVRMMNDVRNLMSELAPERSGTRLHLTGIDAQKYEVTRLLGRDQVVLIPAAVIALAFMLALSFRQVAGVVLPLAVTGVSVLWTLGLYGVSGHSLNPITSLLPPVLMILSVSTSVHLYEHWRRRRAELGERAIAATLRELRFPCSLTSITTAMGMLSLTLSDTPAVRVFGLFSALGVMISLLMSFVLVPIGLSLLPSSTREVPARGSEERERLSVLLEGAAGLSTRHPVAIICIAFAVTAVAVAGIPRIQNNTDLVGFLKPSSLLRQDSLFVDENLSGINTLEIMLSRDDGEVLSSADTIRRLETFRAALLAHEEVSSAQSVLDLLSAIHRAESAGRGWSIPRDEEEILYSLDLLEAAGDADLIRRVMDSGFAHTRVRVQIHSIGSAAAAELEDRLMGEAREIFGVDYAIEVTGAFHQMARDSNRIVRNQVESFSLALGLVILTIGLIFRSPRVLVLSIFPNVVPLIWTAGLMAYLGIDLSTGTTMIASVVIGIAVDDTIHYLTRYRRECARNPSRSCSASVVATTTGIGRALVISSLVLVVGFWVGALGSFLPTIYFSLLTGVTMISALLCDLLVLPASLVLWDRFTPGRAR